MPIFTLFPHRRMGMRLGREQAVDQIQHRLVPVERVDVDPRDSGSQELLRLPPGPGDPQPLHGERTAGEVGLFQRRQVGGGERGPAHGDDAPDHLEAHHRDDTRDDRLVHPRGAGPTEDIELVGVIEEELGHGEIAPLIELQLQVGEVFCRSQRLGVRLGVTGHADPHPRVGIPDEGGEV